MKKIFLAVTSLAIAIASLNFMSQSSDGLREINNKNQGVEKLGKRNMEIPGTDVGGGDGAGAPEYEEYEHPTYSNNTCYYPNKIGECGTIVGSLYERKSWGRIIETDEDWFLFTTPRRANYTFTLNAPESCYNFDVYKYHHDGNGSYSHTETEMVCQTTSSIRSRDCELLPGSYYIRVYSSVLKELDINAKYRLTYSRIYSVTHEPKRFYEYTDPLNGGCEVIVWQNDLVPSNVDRWGEPKQLICETTSGGVITNSGYLDPIFKEKDELGNSVIKEQDNLDAWIYIFDKSVLHELADSCRTLAKYVNDLEYEEVEQIKFNKRTELGEAATDAVVYSAGLLANFLPEPYNAIVDALVFMYDVSSIVSAFCKVFDFDGQYHLTKSAIGWNLDTLRFNCLHALADDNLGIRIPRYSRLEKGLWNEYNAYWLTSSIQPKLVEGTTYEDADEYFLVRKDEFVGSYLRFTDFDHVTHDYYGSLTFYKDMKEFASSISFDFGYDIETIVGGDHPQYDRQAPVKALESISVSGNYQTTFMAGEPFNTDGMFVTAHYTDGTREALDYSNVTYCAYDDENHEDCLRGVDNVTDADMYNEGNYWVLVFFRAPVINIRNETVGVITKFAKYRIKVMFEREEHVSFAAIDVKGSDLTYIDGHGETCYYLNKTISIPIANGNQSIWSSVECLDYETVGNLDIYFIKANIDRENGCFDVIIKSNNRCGRSTVYIDFKYETIVLLPVLDSISISNIKDEYFVGEDFERNELTVVANYTSGESEEVYDYDLDLSDFKKYEPGEHTITISYTLYGVTKTTSHTVLVKKPRLVSIMLLGNYQKEFDVGDDFNYEGMEVLARYENDTGIFMKDGFYVDDTLVNMNCPGAYDVTVYYTEDGITKTDNYVITVNALVLESISLTVNCQTTFEVGDEFSSDGLIVTAHYANGRTIDVTDFLVITRHVDMNTVGTYTVSVIYEENDISKIATYEISVVYSGVAVSSISLSGDYQTEFNLGQSFNHDGLIVTAHYSDGSSRVVENYSAYVIGSMDKLGNRLVCVEYSEHGTTVSAFYHIRVSAMMFAHFLDSISLSGNFKTKFRLGQAFTTGGLIVTANYTDGTSAVITDYEVDSGEFSSLLPGTYTIKITYTEMGITKTATYDVTVTFRIVGDLPDDPVIPFPGGKF